MANLIGIGLTILFAVAGTPILEWLFKKSKLWLGGAPEGIPEELWKALRVSGAEFQGKLLGNLERLVAASAVWTSSYEIIVGLLAFKVASKWEIWSNVVRLPDEIPGIEPLTYLRARRLWGSNMLMRFLIGSFANVLLGFAAAYGGRELSAVILAACAGNA
jgi:hypothetical protein